ncbi:MAG: asparagine synthase (glutamine-hydrolyzing) [Patescibacteria group bacterium]
MCGIAGIVTRHGSSPDEGLLRRMSACITHRGPDGEGVWVAPGVGLAHRRLAIIDLSPSGAQPMHDAGQRFTIIFNGEIYNFRELRAELEAKGATFHSSSDTEVILEAYRAWGDACFTKLRGMFALAIWDAQTKRLVLTRDKIGKKPLFYAFTPEHDLVFASELKALAPVIDLKPDWDAVRLFLGLQYVPSPRTGFHEMFQLPPGTIGTWDENGWKITTYHEWSVGARFIAPGSAGRSEGVINRAPTDIDASIRSAIDDAVKVRQLAADVPVGAFLSGGVDSAAIVAFASKHVLQPLKTYTMGFPQLHMDERREARAIAEHFHTDHHEFEATPEHLQSLVDELVTHYDAPYADSSALPLWLLAEQTSKDIKVVLTGDGGDEAFGGYRRYAWFEKADRIKRMGLSWFAANAAWGMDSIKPDPRYRRFATTLEGLRKSYGRGYADLFTGSYFDRDRIKPLLRQDFLEKTHGSDATDFVASRYDDALGVEGALRFDLTSYLPDDLNVKMDRATMRFGLEARAPLLDENVVRLALSLPLKEKVDRGKTKIALKRALKGVVPDDVLDRPKRGFQVPLAEWFRGPLAPLIKDRCLDPQSPLSSIMNLKAIQHLVDENARGADHGNRLWMLLSLSTWLSHYA